MIFFRKSHLFTALLSLAASTSALAEESPNYSINFDKAQTYTHASRRLNGITLKSADGSQSASIDNPQTIYTNLTSQAFSAKAGETVTATFNYSGNWMHGFVYLDQGRNGSFDATLNADGTFENTSDLVAFSYAEPTLGSGVGYNSKGERVSDSNVLQPPAFRIPENLPDGYYSMRYKVDWAGIDPGGRITETNDIITNGGAICDIRLNIHGEMCKVSVANSDGGCLALNGEAFEETEVLFGKALTLDLLLEEGFMFEAIRIKHGHHLSGEQFIGGTQQWSEEIIPGYLATDGKLTLPAQYIDGEVRMEAFFIKTADFVRYENYSWPSSDKIFSAAEYEAAGNIVKRISATATKGGSSEININEAQLAHSHRNLIAGKEISVVPGDSVCLNIFDKNDFKLKEAGNIVKLYIDLNQDGHFGTGIYDRNGLPLPGSEVVNSASGRDSVITFSINELMPHGKYRARLVAGDETVESNCATATDFMINVHPQALKFSVFSTNGSVHGNAMEGLPATLTYGAEQILRPMPVTTRNYKADGMRIRHGHNLDGEQFINGNKQWSEYTVDARTYTMPGDSVDGEVRVYVDYIHTGSGYTLVFSDEFNAEDGTLPDGNKWVRCPRYSATWNRWLSINDEEHAATGYIEDGKFVALSIPNPFKDTDNVDMITGGIKTMGKFGFTYGKVECRAKSNPWKGNFPAIWLMPEDQSAGWPNCGEIDIWEVIDTQHTTYHTVHSNWTYNLGNKNNPQSSFNKSAPQDTWHTFGFVWNATKLEWYVDGELVGTYNKSTSEDALSKGQWPFDKDYHVILNQSVGNGAWAAWADINHTYRTEFDWIRVYQLNGQTNTAISTPTASVEALDVEEMKNGLKIHSPQPKQVSIYDSFERKIFSQQICGTKDFRLSTGIYIVNGTKHLVP